MKNKMRKNNLLIATCIFFSLMLFGAMALQAQSWQPQLNSLNRSLQTYDNGSYGHLEVKDGTVYLHLKSGVIVWFRMEDIQDAEMNSDIGIKFRCKSKGCVTAGFEKTVGFDKYDFYGFFSSTSRNHSELATLFNNFKNAYLKNPVAATSATSTKTPSDSTAKGSTAPYAQLAGLWNITTKDHRTGSASNAQMEIRAADGKLEAWRVVNGKADIKYTNFNVFKDGNDISYTFELNVTSLKVEGVGKVSNSLAGMTGSQIMSMNGIQFSGDWTATKAGAPSSNTTAATKIQPTTTTASQAQELKPFFDYNKLTFGYKDTKGNVVIQPKYNEAHYFSEGLAAVNIGQDKNGLGGKWGFIDVNGKEVVPIIYNYVYDFKDGKVNVELNGRKFYIDKTGKEIDDKGNTAVQPKKYDYTENFFEGLATVKLNGKWGYIDKAGKEVIPLKYDTTRDFSEGLAAVKLNGKWGFIDRAGKEVIPFKYDAVYFQFSEGFAAVKLSGKWGFIDNTGKEVITAKYESAELFKNGKAKVTLNGREFYIDKTGKEIK